MRLNLRILFSVLQRLVSYLILVVIAGLIWWYSTDIRIMFGNYGEIHTYTDIVLSMIMIFVFPLFLVALWYKSWKYGIRADINKKTSTGMLGGMVGTIISGASCCGATLATSFGLLPLMSLLPYAGLELKLIWAMGLLYATWDIVVNLETCQVRQ